MNILISIILTLLVFTIIVTIHEGGHFLMAKKMGVYVQEFAIGMGPVLYKHRCKDGMQFSIRALPIGGFCQMKGEEQEEGVEPEEDSFTGKKPWQRALIVAAGPVMNFILAFLLALILNITVGYVDTTIQSVDEGYPAEAAGFEPGDRLYTLNGERLRCYNKMSFLLMFLDPEEEITMSVVTPDGQVKTDSFVLKLDEEEQRYRVGFSFSSTGTMKDRIKTEGFFPALGKELAQSFWDTLFEVEMTVRSFGMILTGKVGLDGLAGPIGIVSVVNDTYTEASAYGIGSVVATMADLMMLISANLGVLNLFPIPGLDGSRLVFLLVERIRRKPMNAKVENAIYLTGFILLFGLMILVAFNDVLRLIR